ncbi:uncharacterized protein LOC128864899 [Anastrepha ludens]|uniref:uncharacterized protein LOC128864899 n=1 Tax=Anastrepha ludens TaxID=28586 RepID=UPI0023AFE56E|nr:uncharacterized protein LOC128864899 [Anastrepha ludens]
MHQTNGTVSSANGPSTDTAADCSSSHLNANPNQPRPRDRTVLLATALVKVRDCSGHWQPARLLFDSGSHASFVTESSLCFTVDALFLPKITSDLPTQPLKVSAWPHIQNLFLADQHFMKPGRIDILVGMDVMVQLLCSEIRKGPPGTPVAQRTVFGWTLFANVDESESTSLGLQSLHCEVHLDRALTRLWELEEAPKKAHLTYEERYFEEFCEKTHRRSPDGRFIVELPLKSDVPLGASRSYAVRSLLSIEKRLARDDDLRQRYNEFMQELIDMKHMELAPPPTDQTIYMPHHPVIKESSVTTKLRVDFNASAKTTTGNSLNDALFVGPQFQPDLYSILTRFRTHRYAVTADIAKMYRQICMSTKNLNLQRIVWRRDPTLPIKDYRMLRVTYGVAAASYLAVKSLQQTAKYSSHICEKAAAVIHKDFYMDDLLTGASSKEELLCLQRNVSEILKEGGFELRKWASNCAELFENVSNASENISHYLVDSKDVHALGLIWNTEEDYFTFSVNLNQPPTILTMRTFLSDASTLFDPLGLLAPATIRSKMWFQEIWRMSVGWDDVIPDCIAAQSRHRSELLLLSSLKISRWFGSGAGESFTELHIFADVSERAYAAVLYARTLHNDGSITVVLISSKIKVAPLKTTTLPRLELCAAHLAAKLARSVLHSWGDLRYPIYAWTDSTITLAWLQAHPSKWITFVANRVADIQEVLPPECWNHIRSELNPADCASRGVTPSELLHQKLWWSGPEFLKGPDHFWKLSPLRRIIAYVLRFFVNARVKTRINAAKRVGSPCCQEISEAELRLISRRKPIPILTLHPYLDEKNVLRIGGRIKNAEVAADVRHPIILPKNCPLAKLIIHDIHEFTLDAGPPLMQTILQRRYWVIGARSLIRSTYRKCVKCTCLNRNLAAHSMGDLPAAIGRCLVPSPSPVIPPLMRAFGSAVLLLNIHQFLRLSSTTRRLPHQQQQRQQRQQQLEQVCAIVCGEQ